MIDKDGKDINDPEIIKMGWTDHLKRIGAFGPNKMNKAFTCSKCGDRVYNQSNSMEHENGICQKEKDLLEQIKKIG